MKNSENQKKIEQKTKAKKKKNTLTPKQKRFCDEYLIDLNGTQAAIRAGFSKKSAYRYAIELLQKTHVAKYIEQCQKQLAKKTGISQERVLNELAKIAFADLKDFAAWRTEKTQVGIDEKTFEPIIGYDVIIEVKNSDEIDGHVISEIGRGKDGTFKFKPHDKLKAIESISRILGFNKDKHEHSGGIDLNLKGKIDMSGLTTDELRRLANIRDTE